MGLFPKEHGAYGQITFPLIAAFAVAGASLSGVLVATAVIAGFLAHEPGLVILGQRFQGEARARALRQAVVGVLCPLERHCGDRSPAHHDSIRAVVALGSALARSAAGGRRSSR